MPSMTVYGTPSRQERGLPCLYLHTMCLWLGSSLHCWEILQRKRAATHVQRHTILCSCSFDRWYIMSMRIIAAAA